MSDQELIRKAAEAIWEFEKLPSIAVNGPRLNVAFEKLPSEIRRHIEMKATAALKVFLEHTRSQPREGHGVRCQDCGAAMTPTPGSSNWTCHSCGKTV